MRLARLAYVTLLAACTGDDDGEAKRPPPPMPAYLIDAAPAPSEMPPPLVPPFDPTEYHLDDDEGLATGPRPTGVATRNRRTLALMLKSSPSGAVAAVDGKVVGRTPVYWEGTFDGREREFTFVLPGYSMARYRFVPTSDGFVHGRLNKVSEDGDGGVPEIPPPLPETPPAPAAAPVERRRVPPTPTQPRPVAPDASVAAPVTTPSAIAPDAGPAAPPADAAQGSL
jgi:hypothetical protein